MKKKLTFILLIAALILEVLPYGAVLNFANPEGESFRSTFSYFDLTPFGYANFGPFLTAVLTVLLLFTTIISFIVKKPYPSSFFSVTAFITVLLSLTPLLYGIRSYSLVGAFISAALLATFITSKLQTTKPQ